MSHSAAADADWVLTADWDMAFAAAGLTVEGNWVLAEDPSSSPRHPRLIGFFLRGGSGRHSYTPLPHSSSSSSSDISVSDNARAADLLSSVPAAASVCASYRGLVLARGPWSSYYISAPISPKWTRIPKPQKAHSLSSPIALAAAGDGFLVVCAVPLEDGPKGFYRFDVYASSTGVWRIGGDLFPMGEVLPNSGVSCNRWVYFRTATPSVAAFDAAAGVPRVLPPPPRCWDGEVRWELAEAGSRLRSICLRNWTVEVHQLGEKDQWELLRLVSVQPPAVASASLKWDGGEPIACRVPPRPLRSQGEELGILLWVDGRVVRWDLERRRAVDFGFFEAASPPGSETIYMPHCSAAELQR